jgi:hypothetical protein
MQLPERVAENAMVRLAIRLGNARLFLFRRGIGIELAGSNFAPEPTHQVPRSICRSELAWLAKTELAARCHDPA